MKTWKFNCLVNRSNITLMIKTNNFYKYVFYSYVFFIKTPWIMQKVLN